MSPRPHVILICADQWRADALGHLGNPAARTPVLDALVADEAVSIAQAHCQHTICTPSRCAFMTGWYPHTCGHRDQHAMLRDADSTILWNLRQAGWRVCWCGKNDLLPAEQGFDAVADVKPVCVPAPYPLYEQTRERRGVPGSDTWYSFYAGRIEDRPGSPVAMDHDWQMLRAAEDLIAGHDPARPLCLYLTLHHPHPPYGVEEPYFSTIDRAALPPRLAAPEDWRGLPGYMHKLHERSLMQGWDEERWDELRAAYLGAGMRTDAMIGRVFDALRARSLWDDSLVIVTSDHGDYAGDHGLVQKDDCSLRTCLTRVPLIVKPPVETPCLPGVRPVLAELTDLSATVYDYTGLAPRWPGFGRSLRAVATDPTVPHREVVFTEGGRPRGLSYLLERSHAGDDLYEAGRSIAREDGPEMGPVALIRSATHAYLRRLDEPDELYDLCEDPSMTRNRHGDPALAAAQANLKDRLLTWYLATADVVPPWRNRRE